MKLKHIGRNVDANRIRAGRLLVNAIDGGAFPKARRERNRDWWDRSIGRIPGRFLAIGMPFEWKEGEPFPHKSPEYIRTAAGELNDEQFAGIWTQAVSSWLQPSFPSRFRHDAADCDWPRIARDQQGYPIDRNGNRLKRRWFKDGKLLPTSFKWTRKLGGGYQCRLVNKVAYDHEAFDLEDWFALMRIRAEVYSDACQVLAELIEIAHFENSPRETGVEDSGLPKYVLALAFLFHDPNISPTDLAEKVGVTRGTLYQKKGNWKKVRDFLLAREDRLLAGKKVEGHLEAWDDGDRQG